MLAHLLFSLLVCKGNLVVVDTRGRERICGDGSGPRVKIRTHNKIYELQLFLNPALAVGEGYMNEKLTVEEGSLYDFLTICLENIDHLYRHPFWSKMDSLAFLFRYLRTLNPIGRARRNVAHHYDLSSRLYELFLDKDRQYSCAYFEHPDQDLESAQIAKKCHIAAKLLLDRPDLDVLDIGCGWGGMALYLAEVSGARVKGVTLSTEQYGIANKRAIEDGLADRVSFALQDYRLEEALYDRIVSVGMFEHVGPRHFREYFAKARQLLKPDGVMLLHAIGHSDPPQVTNSWITKYIFPGGYIPALSEVLAAIQKEGLRVTDIEILRLHYAETLRHWRERFEARREEATDLFDARFVRMWEFYLICCELSFRFSGLMVFQIQLAREHAAVPITRDYIHEWEREVQEDTRQAAE